MSSSLHLEVGSIFAGDYKIVALLAQNTERAVYRVEQVSTGRQLALKILQPTITPNESAKEQFVQRVRQAGRISNRHLLDVRGSGVDQNSGIPWLVTELLDGASVSETIKRETSPYHLWDELLSQLCRGLEAIHKANACHGAINTDTIFLATQDTDGAPFRLVILDFGVSHGSPKTSSEISRLAFLSPEQIKESQATPQSDIWAVGLVMFRVLTGKYFWSTANENASKEAILAEISAGVTTSASERAKALGITQSLPTSFDDWFKRCTAMLPSQRFASAIDALEGAADLLEEASAVAAELEEEGESNKRIQAKRTKPPPLPPVVRAIAERPKQALAFVAILALGALGIGLGLGAILRTPPRQQVATGAVQLSSTTPTGTPMERGLRWANSDRETTNKACQAGDAIACLGIGLALNYGIKTPKDNKQASEMFQKSCELGEGAGCARLAELYNSGDGVAEDKAKAAEYFKRACEKADAQSCFDLANALKDGIGIAKDETKAKSMLERACKLGIHEACSQP